jgi:hypothetical protein
MAIRRSISEIINHCSTIKSKSDKVAWLQENTSQPLQVVLKNIYDSRVEFLIPDTAPPWTPNEFEDEAKSLLFREARRLNIFIKGGGYDNLNKIKRETLFISLLEDLDNDDAKLLANHMISQKPVKGLTKAVVNEAFPNLIEE